MVAHQLDRLRKASYNLADTTILHNLLGHSFLLVCVLPVAGDFYFHADKLSLIKNHNVRQAARNKLDRELGHIAEAPEKDFLSIEPLAYF